MPPGTAMNDGAAARSGWLHLLTWLSPSFPVGAFAYSHGLEQAIAQGAVGDSDSLSAWLADLMERGGIWNDAVLFAMAHRAAAGGDMDEIARAGDLAAALAAGHERHLETMSLGTAFLAESLPWHGPAAARLRAAGRAMAYPVAVAALAADHGIGLCDGLSAYLHAAVQAQVSVAVRLVPLGQRRGLAVLHRLLPRIDAAASRAAQADEDDLGSAAFASDIMAMRHETLSSRVFRT